jgi:hypothetical protein
MRTYVNDTVRIECAIAVSGALVACESNEYVPAADTNEVPPAMDRDMSATVNARTARLASPKGSCGRPSPEIRQGVQLAR